MSKCMFCGGTIEKTTDVFNENIRGKILVENVPCNKCTKCGEKTFSGETWKKLAEIVKENLGKECVINYEDHIS